MKIDEKLLALEGHHMSVLDRSEIRSSPLTLLEHSSA